jgi:hypothetical protein
MGLIDNYQVPVNLPEAWEDWRALGEVVLTG